VEGVHHLVDMDKEMLAWGLENMDQEFLM